MQKKSTFGRDLSKAITSEEILGKNVIDVDGGVIGVVEKVFIDPIYLNFAGISVDKGFIKKGVSIGNSYISKITKHAVFLNIRVAYEIKGMVVFDKDGKNLGTVYSIDLYGSRNKIKNIHVRNNFINTIMKKELVIPYEKIKDIGENIILNVTKKSLSNPKL